jgi:hypothetical protein
MYPSRSALPPIYYAIFGVYEPATIALGTMGAFLDPTKACIFILDNISSREHLCFVFPFLGGRGGPF